MSDHALVYGLHIRMECAGKGTSNLSCYGVVIWPIYPRSRPVVGDGQGRDRFGQSTALSALRICYPGHCGQGYTNLSVSPKSARTSVTLRRC